MANETVNTKPFWRLVFLVYGLLMLWLLFGRVSRYNPQLPYWEQVLANRSTTFFKTIRNFMFVILHRPNHPIFFEVYVNMLGNILLFVPAGILLPKLFRSFRPFWRFAVKTLCIIFTIEVLQMLTLLGVFDVDDILLNMTGLTLGYFLYFLFRRK